MESAVQSVLISASSLFLLVLLFAFEKRKGARLAEPVRAFLDRSVEMFGRFFERVASMLGREVFRQTVHYLFHTFLKSFLKFLRRAENLVDRMLRTNRAMAKKVARERAVRTKLDEIAEHKESIALTPKEKRARKEKSIGTRL